MRVIWKSTVRSTGVYGLWSAEVGLEGDEIVVARQPRSCPS